MSAPELHTKTAALRARTAFFILLIIVFAPLGNVLLSKGMKPILMPANWNFAAAFHSLGEILSSPFIWLGIGSLFIFFFSQMMALNWADYSYVQPASSASYLSLVVFSYLILGEKVSGLRLLGIAVICAGVMVIGRTHPRTTGAFPQ